METSDLKETKAFNLNELSKEIHRNAVAHGWYEERRDSDELDSLYHSELSEALEEYRNGKPLIYFIKQTDNGSIISTDITEWKGQKLEGIVTELADCVIRIADEFGSLDEDLDYRIKTILDISTAEWMVATKNFGSFISYLHFVICQGYIHRDHRLNALAGCIYSILRYCKEQGWNIETAIRLKHEYNKTRPYRHGGKKI